MSFTAEVWSDIGGLLDKILDLPFNRGLAAGTLARERFQFYVIQDSLYLQSFSRALSVAAAKAPDREAMLCFSQGATGAVTVEQALHAGFLDQFGVTAADLAAAEKSPTCMAYTSYILGIAATGSYGELVAAVLPCFWIYSHVGNEIAKTAAGNNPYQPWIDTYVDESFEKAVRDVIRQADLAAAAASDDDRAAMRRAFHRASIYEWMFWDSAYRREGWPVGL